MLGSGSAGNATLVSCAGTRVLLDVGFSYRELSRRLGEVGVDPGMLDAVLITHGHGDHTRGLRVLSNRHGVRAYATAAIREEWRAGNDVDWHGLAPGVAVDLGGLRFIPFQVPHDASETVAFRIETPEGAIGYATDIGTLTPLMIERFHDCRLLVIESNHATELLRVSPYARSTRRWPGSPCTAPWVARGPPRRRRTSGCRSRAARRTRADGDCTRNLPPQDSRTNGRCLIRQSRSRAPSTVHHLIR